MTRIFGLELAALTLCVLALGTNVAPAKKAPGGLSSEFPGFHRVGVQVGGWNSVLGLAAPPVGLRQVHRGCFTQRLVTDDGEFIVHRICN